MKYIDFFSNDDNFEQLKKFKYKLIEKKYIYSDEGVFLVLPNKIVKIEYVDIPIKYDIINFNNIEKKIYIDESKELSKEQIYQVPYNHAIIKQELHKFSINEKSNVKLNIIKQNNEIVDLFFEITDKIEHQFIKEDIFTLLFEDN